MAQVLCPVLENTDMLGYHSKARLFLKKVQWRLNALSFGEVPAFVHVPKTGGTFLSQSETFDQPVLSPMRKLGHVCVTGNPNGRSGIYPPVPGLAQSKVISKQKLAKYFAFATVRNPFTWLVSYAGHAAGWNPKYRNPEHYDYEIANKGFEYLLKTIAEREGNIWPSRKFIHFQLFADDGAFVVDWINRTETLRSDLELMATTRNYVFRKDAVSQRSGGIKDYRSYYTDELIDVVKSTWARELKLFGYDVDSLDSESALLKHHIDTETKKRFRYNWSDNTFYVDGNLWE